MTTPRKVDAAASTRRKKSGEENGLCAHGGGNEKANNVGEQKDTSAEWSRTWMALEGGVAEEDVAVVADSRKP